jgi:hypothetical protein
MEVTSLSPFAGIELLSHKKSALVCHRPHHYSAASKYFPGARTDFGAIWPDLPSSVLKLSCTSLSQGPFVITNFRPVCFAGKTGYSSLLTNSNLPNSRCWLLGPFHQLFSSSVASIGCSVSIVELTSGVTCSEPEQQHVDQLHSVLCCLQYSDFSNFR